MDLVEKQVPPGNAVGSRLCDYRLRIKQRKCILLGESSDEIIGRPLCTTRSRVELPGPFKLLASLPISAQSKVALPQVKPQHRIRRIDIARLLEEVSRLLNLRLPHGRQSRIVHPSNSLNAVCVVGIERKPQSVRKSAAVHGLERRARAEVRRERAQDKFYSAQRSRTANRVECRFEALQNSLFVFPSRPYHVTKCLARARMNASLETPHEPTTCEPPKQTHGSQRALWYACPHRLAAENAKGIVKILVVPRVQHTYVCLAVSGDFYNLLHESERATVPPRVDYLHFSLGQQRRKFLSKQERKSLLSFDLIAEDARPADAEQPNIRVFFS